jgi:hypothetical protein
VQELEYYLPPVDPADIKILWKEHAENPGCVIGVSLLASLYSPGADFQAISRRYSIIELLRMNLMGDLLADHVHDGQPDDVVFRIAANIPLERREIGAEYDGLPFDADEFVKRLRDEANC